MYINKQLLEGLVYHLLALWKFTRRAFPFNTSQIIHGNNLFFFYPLYFFRGYFHFIFKLFLRIVFQLCRQHLPLT